MNQLSKTACEFEEYEYGGHGVCLGDGQTEAYLKDMGMTGLVSAWAMARRRPKEYRHKVNATTAYVRISEPDLKYLHSTVLEKEEVTNTNRSEI